MTFERSRHFETAGSPVAIFFCSVCALFCEAFAFTSKLHHHHCLLSTNPSERGRVSLAEAPRRAFLMCTCPVYESSELAPTVVPQAQCRYFLCSAWASSSLLVRKRSLRRIVMVHNAFEAREGCCVFVEKRKVVVLENGGVPKWVFGESEVRSWERAHDQ